jgi:hypothetical protein
MLLLTDGGIFVGSFCNDLIDGPGRYYNGGLAIEQVCGSISDTKGLFLSPYSYP